MSSSPVLDQLVALSRSLGEPSHEYVILSEGNTSARVSERSFFVKESGRALAGSGPECFAEMSLLKVLDLLIRTPKDPDQLRTALREARLDPAGPRPPSIETLFHAYLLSLKGVHFVGHTHPIPVNAVLCSRRSREAAMGRLFPEEMTICGPARAYVEYADPGPTLARNVADAADRFIVEYGAPPKVMLMENHGMIALGETAEEVERITAMTVKSFRILLGTTAWGGPRFLAQPPVKGAAAGDSANKTGTPWPE
jgi:rhamnose utilization protein RhaD (predicted bifunctional aldolase and dehydrogenase)